MPSARIDETARDARAVVAVDIHGSVAAFDQSARALLGLADTDVGRSIDDHPSFDRPTELRASIRRVVSDLRPLIIDDVEVPGATGRSMDIHISPLWGAAAAVVGTAVVFVETTELQRTVAQLESVNEQLSAANDALAKAAAALEAANDELEAASRTLHESNNVNDTDAGGG